MLETEPTGTGRKAALVYSAALAEHELSEMHPMKPVRIRLAYELADAAGFLEAEGAQLAPPRPATDEELALFHDRDYIDAVRAIGAGLAVPDEAAYGFGQGDNPTYPGIFDAQALSAGGTMAAAELVTRADVGVAFAPAGGLHHAMPRRASGFCVFNDPVMAIEALVREGRRVVYVDIDCHHGDGVQHAFYGSRDVMTISLHESGQFLFPGTGSVGESGEGDGEGYSVNVPLAPYTDDETYSLAFEAVVPPLIEAFAPDVLFTQLGIDTHYLDPITHLRLTTQGFARTVARLGELVGPETSWVAAGGGGYDLGAVARGWSMAFAVMAGVDIPDRIPEEFTEYPGLSTFADEQPAPLEPAVAEQVRAFAERSVEEVRNTIFPHFELS